MNPRHALRPDLEACELEDRVLLFAPGLFSSGFLPSTTSSASLIVSGFQNPGGSGGSTIFPGPSFFYLLVGGNGSSGGLSNGTGSAGVSVYGATTNNGFVTVSVSGAGAGSSTGSSAPTGGVAGTVGYSSSVSSGYSTALTSTNNYGVSTSPVGSIPVHSFDTGSGTPVTSTDPNSPSSMPGNSTPDSNTELWNTLLRRNSRGMTSPGTMMPSTSGMPGMGNP